MTEYQIALAYLAALAIVCLALFTFTSFLPKPENTNKAKSTYFFRVLLLFVMATQAAFLFRYEHAPLTSILLSSLFMLLIAYSVMCAIYSRYDVDTTSKHYVFIGGHCLLLLGSVYALHQYTELAYWRAVLILVNLSLPFGLTMRLSHQQFKKHRLGDRVLYSALLITILLYLIYTFSVCVFFRGYLFAPITLTFISLLSFVCILFLGSSFSLIFNFFQLL